jgi:subtilisin family serine protease
MFRLLFIAFILLSQFITAQDAALPRANILAYKAAQQSEQKPFPLLVDADIRWLEKFCAEGHAHYGGRVLGYHRIVLTPRALQLLLKAPALRQIVWEGGAGFTLSDTSKINARTYRLHRGDTLLPRAYTGHNVVLGFVDTGIDFLHPDFQDSLGQTRIHAIWDQTRNADTSRRPDFGYGEVYFAADINAGQCPHIDPNSYSGHGTMVAGNAAGNGRSVPDSIADYSGHAPGVRLIMVASSFGNNFTQSVADGVAFIFEEADKLGLPAVVNLSLGTYLGSHDGLDEPALQIDSMIQARNGRAIVAAVGNAGHMPPWHLQTRLAGDTAFTWFANNGNSGFGTSSLFFELWADTAQLNQVQFGILQTDTSWRDTLYPLTDIRQRLDVVHFDTLQGNALFITYAQRRGGQYFVQVVVAYPLAGVRYGFLSRGWGKFDVWSASWLGLSDIYYQGLPDSLQYARMRYYRLPDTLQSMVSSWACSPSVITVSNFNNRFSYLNTEGQMRQSTDLPVGARGRTSSRGPDRLLRQKPDVAAPGNFTVATGRLTDLQFLKNTPSARYKLAKGDHHFSNGGSSMAAPVVSGIVALMLERCKDMTHTQIAESLRKTAFTDGFTGTVPNAEFGYGKIDGLAAITRLQKGVSLTALPSSACMGIPVSVSPLGTFQRNIWNTGDTIAVFASRDRDTVWAKVMDTDGCEYYTDTLVVQRFENPLVQIIGDSVICVGASTALTTSVSFAKYHWSSGDSTSILSVSDSGRIWVSVSDSNTCVGSDTIQVRTMDCTPVFKEEELLYSRWRVFPQPAAQNLFIAVQKDEIGPYTAELLSLQGVCIRRIFWNNQIGVLPLEGLPSGFYILRGYRQQHAAWAGVVVVD